MHIIVVSRDAIKTTALVFLQLIVQAASVPAFPLFLGPEEAFPEVSVFSFVSEL